MSLIFIIFKTIWINLITIISMRKFIIIMIMVGFNLMATAQTTGINDIAKDVITNLQQGKMDSVVLHFDDIMKKELSQEKLKIVWKDLTNQCGNFIEYITVTNDKIDNYDIVFITCRFEKMSLRMKTVFNNQNKVSGLWFVP